MTINIRSVIGTLSVFACLFPYVMPFALGSDVQPLSVLLIGIYFLFNNRVRFGGAFVGLSIFCLFSVFNLRENSLNDNSQLFVVFFSYIFIPIIFLFGTQIKPVLLLPAIRLWLILVIVGIVLQLFVTEAFLMLEFFFNLKVVDVGVRGWSSFSPEPTDLAFTSVIVLVCLFLVSSKSSVRKPEAFLLVVIALGCLAGSGFFALILISAIYVLFGRALSSTLVLAGVCFLILFSFSDLLSSFRPISLFLYLLTDPYYLVEKTSFFYRVFQNIVAFDYFKEHYGVPSGLNTFHYAIDDLDRLRYMELFPSRSEYVDFFFDANLLSVKNVLARWLVENGLVAVAFIVWFLGLVCISVKRVGVRYRYMAACLFLLYIFQSFPLFYPPIWFMLGLLFNRGFWVPKGFSQF